MQYYIKEWPNQTASLIAEDGHPLDTFSSIDEAIDTCSLQCLVEPIRIERYFNYLAKSPIDFESSYI